MARNIQRQAASPSHSSLVRAARGRGDDVVDQQSDEDPEHDRQLLQGPKPPADPRRRDLGDVGRSDDGGDADAEPADDPKGDQPFQVVDQARAERAD
jgi:hypothetical protein